MSLVIQDSDGAHSLGLERHPIRAMEAVSQTSRLERGKNERPDNTRKGGIVSARRTDLQAKAWGLQSSFSSSIG